MPLKKLVYSSRRIDTAPGTLERILSTSRQNNRRDAITGVLFHDGKRYVQLLEGDHDAIGRCFLRIAMNPNHREIEIGVFADSAVRLFVNWDMRSIAADRRQPSLSTEWRRLIALPQARRLERFETLALTLAA